MAVKKSKGHIAFAGEYEFFKFRNGDIYRVSKTNTITEEGYRSGARFESTPSNWQHFGKMVIQQASKKY